MLAREKSPNSFKYHYELVNKKDPEKSTFEVLQATTIKLVAKTYELAWQHYKAPSSITQVCITSAAAITTWCMRI